MITEAKIKRCCMKKFRPPDLNGQIARTGQTAKMHPIPDLENCIKIHDTQSPAINDLGVQNGSKEFYRVGKGYSE